MNYPKVQFPEFLCNLHKSSIAKFLKFKLRNLPVILLIIYSNLSWIIENSIIKLMEIYEIFL